MKKIMIGIMVLILCFAFTACGGEAETEEPESAEATMEYQVLAAEIESLYDFTDGTKEDSDDQGVYTYSNDTSAYSFYINADTEGNVADVGFQTKDGDIDFMTECAGLMDESNKSEIEKWVNETAEAMGENDLLVTDIGDLNYSMVKTSEGNYTLMIAKK